MKNDAGTHTSGVNTGSVYNESIGYTFFKTLTVQSLRPEAIRCIISILSNFFLRQYHAAWLPGRVPVSKVDHPLDQKIPFVPAWVTIYIDFVCFWIRMLAFLLHTYRHKAYDAVREFIISMGRLYAFAAEAYRKNFSTTERPFYIARPRFFLIHLVDPHLMCIPSLHVMVVVYTYKKFIAILHSFGEAEKYTAQIEEMRQGALAISQAILFVKQHSVNCIPAAYYALTRFAPCLFPPHEAEAFNDQLFQRRESKGDGLETRRKNSNVHPCSAPQTEIPECDAAEIKAHIISLYREFIKEGKTTHSWEDPLLFFLKKMPQ